MWFLFGKVKGRWMRLQRPFFNRPTRPDMGGSKQAYPLFDWRDDSSSILMKAGSALRRGGRSSAPESAGESAAGGIHRGSLFLVCGFDFSGIRIRDRHEFDTGDWRPGRIRDLPRRPGLSRHIPPQKIAALEANANADYAQDQRPLPEKHPRDLDFFRRLDRIDRPLAGYLHDGSLLRLKNSDMRLPENFASTETFLRESWE
jgi:hypothetical protein